MATKKQYIEQAKKLKKLGVYNYNIRDLKTELNNNKTVPQKSVISRLWKEHKNHGNKKAFVKRHVSHSRAKQLKQSGFSVAGQTVFIPTDGFDPHKIRIRGNSVVYKNHAREERTRLVIPGSKSKGNLVSLIENEFKRPMTFGYSVTVRIGDNAPFSIRFNNAERLNRYLSRWSPRDPKSNRERLISQMRVVKIFDADEWQPPEKPKRARVTKRQRIKGR
jgi:hypothetical protein